MNLWSVALLTALGGCTTYGCGEYTFTASTGTWELGEWCGGGYGTFGQRYGTSGPVSVIVDPSSADDDAVSAGIFHTVLTNFAFDTADLVDGASLSLGQGLEASCTITPAGAGSGSLRVVTPVTASLEIGRSRRATNGDEAYEMRWAADCGGDGTSSGDDVVDLYVD